MSSLQSRVLVAVIGVPVLVWVVLWAPPFVMTLALMALSAVAADELQNCVSGEKHSRMAIVAAIFSIFTVDTYVRFPEMIGFEFTMMVVVLFGYAIYKAGEVKFQQLMAALVSSCVIASSFSAFLRMEAAGIHRAYLLLPFILSFACDTFAYFAGRAFGRHKLAPKVSPKKTVEGAIGGLLGNVACGLLFAFVMNRWFEAGIGYGPMAVLALLCGVAAQIGDLSFSLIKREFGIKDYGRLFLEHGGVLDRFDSVLFVAPFVEQMLWLLNF